MKILDFPLLRQAYEYDCGANALQAVFAYYGLELDEDIIMREAKTSKSGTRFENIVKIAKKYRFKVDFMEMNLEQIRSYIDKKVPVIILLQAWSEKARKKWTKDWKDGHYVVAIGYGRNKIYFADPYSFNRVFLSDKEIIERWHDINGKRKYVNYGLAMYGKVPKFDSKKINRMG